MALNKNLLLFVFSPGSVHRRDMMMREMSGSRKNVASVVATTYIPVHGFSDIVEETDIQEFFASMLY
jgi:hypothetical protein